jgi:signal transduction histidine kinase/DNA-binding response OmpR family regulator
MRIGDLSGCRIQLIDDEQLNIELLTAFLEEDGFRHLAATRDPREAVAQFDSFRPDLVLLDLHMPYLDGIAVMEALAGRRAADDWVPILVLTADITPESRLRALRAGANDFLTKPLDAGEVLLRIRNLLATRVLYTQQQAARVRAEADRQRAEFLAEASRMLGQSLDAQTTLAVLPRLAVPRIADYCVVDLTEGDGPPVRTGAAHIDPAGEAVLRQENPLWAGVLPIDHPMVRALTQGQFVLLGELDPESLATEGATPDELETLRALRPCSLVSVPLVVAGRVGGAISLGMSSSGRRFGPDDLALAEELVRRAGSARENAMLYRDAQEATRARDQILAVVAHDLRNPLSTIRMAADLVLDLVGDAPYRRHLETLRRSTERMDSLIQDLIEVARIESGKLTLQPRPESVDVLVAEAAAMLRPLAEARGIIFEAGVAERLPDVHADSTRLLQVISNLAGNAIKFTPPGGTVRVACAARENTVRFSVTDTGPGIPPEQIPHLFGRFWQADAGDRRGIGLGLSIARGIVESHGGRIWVESEVGRGTAFQFTIPVVPSSAVQLPSPLAIVEGERAEETRV